MKKKIIIFFSFVLLFSFLFSVPSLALFEDTVYILQDNDDALYYSQTYLGYEFYRLECNGISYYDTNEIIVSCSDLSSLYFIIFPLGISEYGNAAEDSHYITIKDDKRYKLDIDLSVYFDDIYSSSFACSSIYWNSIKEPLPSIQSNLNKDSVSFSSVFTTQNVLTTQINHLISEFENYPGRYYSGMCLGFDLTDIPTADNCRIVINSLSISIYDPDSLFFDEDFGYTPPEADTNNVLTAMNDIASDANTMLSTVVNFSDDIGENFDNISLKLDSFKANILTPIYDSFPDWLTLLLVFAVCLLIVRRAVRR